MSEPEKEEDLSIKETTDEVEEDEDVEFFTESNKFKQMLFENLHGISKKFNLKYPINPKITYEYPPINPVICQNIISALYKYPNFYTQTLHLMNKMNLPCPIVDYVREPYVNYFPTTSQTQVFQTTTTLESEAKTVEESSSESEIETDFDPRSQQLTVAPAESQIKKVNVKSLLKSSVAKSSSKDPESTKIDEVFDRTDI